VAGGATAPPVEQQLVPVKLSKDAASNRMKILMRLPAVVVESSITEAFKVSETLLCPKAGRIFLSRDIRPQPLRVWVNKNWSKSISFLAGQ
jgi:hypothetical protein